MKIEQTTLPEVFLIKPDAFSDNRGVFAELWHDKKYSAVPGMEKLKFTQDNFSVSNRYVLRGMHFQNPAAQAKLVTVVHGQVYDAVIDVRVGSPTFGKWYATTLNCVNMHQLFIPAGFAHGFCVVGAPALFHYKCSDHYTKDAELGVAFDDPDIGISWPIDKKRVIVSDKDALYPRLRDISMEKLPKYA